MNAIARDRITQATAMTMPTHWILLSRRLDGAQRRREKRSAPSSRPLTTSAERKIVKTTPIRSKLQMATSGSKKDSMIEVPRSTTSQKGSSRPRLFAPRRRSLRPMRPKRSANEAGIGLLRARIRSSRKSIRIELKTVDVNPKKSSENNVSPRLVATTLGSSETWVGARSPGSSRVTTGAGGDAGSENGEVFPASSAAVAVTFRPVKRPTGIWNVKLPSASATALPS